MELISIGFFIAYLHSLQEMRGPSAKALGYDKLG